MSWIELQTRLSAADQIRIDESIVSENLDWIGEQMKSNHIVKGHPVWCQYKQMLVETIVFSEKVKQEAEKLAKQSYGGNRRCKKL